MKYLTERSQIAKAMNFGKYPVVRINLETPKAGLDDCFLGDSVLVAQSHTEERADHIRCQIHKFGDEPYRYTLMPEAICLDASFGYHDVIEMLEWAQAPVIYAGEKVIVIEDYPQKKTCRVHLMKVSDKVKKFVYPTAYLEECEEEKQ